MGERLLTPEEVAEKLRVSRLTVMSYLRSGVLKGTKVGRLWRISEEDLSSFLARSKSSRVSVVSDAVSGETGKRDSAAYAGRQGPSYASDESDSRWLEADVGGPLPSWDWGPAGRPAGTPVRYVAGVGLIIEGKKRHGE